jgi:CubicO group peptidase (beta-lactamase class C family)
MLKIKIIVSFLFLITGISAQEICLIDSAIRQKIDSTYLALLKEHKVSGLSLAIVDNGKIVYAKGYGFSDVKKEIPASSQSVYRIGSITKSFTAMSIMQLQREGKLSINDDLKKHIPEFAIGFQKDKKHPVILRQMMAHTSGLPSDILNGFFTENPLSNAWLIDQIGKTKMSYPSAYSHSYSNLGYGLLGEVIARKSSISYENYMQTMIFSPLKMHTSFVYPTDSKLTPKSYVGKQEINEPLIMDAAAGLIHSTVEDMSNYIMLYLNRGKFEGKRILDSLSILEMEKRQTDELLLPESSNFGYGLYSDSYYLKKGADSSKVTIIGHGGDTYTFHADMKYIPELGIGVVLLTNSTGGNLINSGQRLLRIYLKAKDASTLKLITPDSLPTIKSDFEKGTYCITNFIFEAKNEEKLSFKQGPAKIVAKKQMEGYYTMKAFIFGFIPFKIKDQAFSFEKIEDRTYIKALNLKNKSVDYIGYKIEKYPVSIAWKKAKGTYEVINPIACQECKKMDLNFENLKLKVSEKKGLVHLRLYGKNVGVGGSFYGTNESENCVISVGIGRSNGETFLLLENGNIFYSGFEFKRIK